ncbi:Carboxypeptidase regulatory-like domain-containing protein [Chishuiella changwenlii]|uniref:Carboxypeptidase regulatory-like domain-containing protein n=1 Tax=Chishuiella changwenlii TaxID=1434701 RepID=A0A1M6ZET6_9FLAO|nr:carboxypeptidase regulatory-like domain-containing protein [Chishuiella changwenlii]GGE86283.1 TonB-dependent receptor [Chishuiella changwenlii]SHL28855.1 Carboxypeptidase regulatory-like domain-containing protein [Chishuiella changwenlii]
MNKLLLSLSLFAATVAMAQAQTKITGVAKNAATGEEVYNLTVRLEGVAVSDAAITDRIGYFQFVDIPNGTYKLQVYGVGYDPYEKEITVADEKELDLGDIKLTFNPNTAEVGIITLTDDELSDDESTTASNSGILQSSRDVFARVSAYELGSYWFKPRGLDNKYNDIHFNGVRMNKMDNGRATFNNWGGLNDVTRRPEELTYGIEPSNYAFGDLGGVTNFDTRPSTMRKGTSLAYSSTNRSYRNRVMATYNTGMMDNGWAFMVSGSRRWADEGLIQGTFYDAYAYFVGIEKKINNNHTLNFTSFGAPTRRATGSPNTQEVVDMKGIYYNSFWGWQDGEKRNERIKKTFEPVNMLTHHWAINNKSKLTTTLSYQFGKESGSRLDWFAGNNPSPVYYRNLPSYIAYSGGTQSQVDAQRELWTSGQISQLDWGSLYRANAFHGERAVYWLTADVNEDRTATAYTNFQTELAPNIDVTIAASYQKTNSKLYREVQDLLGAGYVLNRDNFSGASFNVLDTDYVARKGDKQGYNYEINRDYADLYAQSKIKGKYLDVTIGMKTSMTKFYRDSKWMHGLYQDSSYGRSKTYDFINYGVKTNFLVKLDGRNFIQANVMYQTEAPTSDEIFPNARVNNVTVEGVESAKIFSSDLSYVLRAPRVKARATAFYTRTKDEIEKAFGYIDGANDQVFVSEVMTGVGKEYMGTELAIEAQILPVLTVSAVASIGQYLYKDNPNYNLYSDDFARFEGVPYKDFGTAYLNNYKVGNGPQSGFSLGLEYRDPKFWWVGVSGNFLANNYIDPAAFRRTVNFFTDANGDLLNVNEQDLKNVLKQEKLDDQFMLNVNLGKTFRIGKYSAGISGTVNNVLNNRNYVTGGFEQLRIGNYNNAMNSDYRTLFGSRMFYGMGTTYFANIYFRF